MGQSRVLLTCLLCAFALTAGSAAAATTRFVSPTGPGAAPCTNASSPCNLAIALASAQAGDNISLANGTYVVGGVALPPVPLHWAPTDPQTRPVLASGAAAPTIGLTAAQSGSSFEHVEIDNVAPVIPAAQPALRLEPGVAATVRSSVINGRRCVDAPDSGPLTIEDSTISTDVNAVCLSLSAQSTLRHSTVRRQDGILPENPSSLIITNGLVEDSRIAGSVLILAPTAVVRRSTVVGSFGILGEGLIADSVVKATGRQAAITASGLHGGTLRVINSTAISEGGSALRAAAVISETGPVVPNDLVVTNSIARGATTDIEGTGLIACELGSFCDFGLIHIDHSDFVTRTPLATTREGVVITEGAGNLAGDPLFADAARDDYHLRPGSPAIDAGTPLDQALPTDLDGLARVQGTAPDLGAFETPAPPATTGGGGGGGGGMDGGGTPPARPAVLSRLRVTPSRFRVGGRRGGTRVRFVLDKPSRVTLTFGRLLAGGRRLRAAGRLAIARGRTGANAVRFFGRFARKLLARGRYRVIATPDLGRSRTATFTILGRRR